MDARTETPFFIVGAHRSGTTMLRLMLNAHPRLAVPFESDFIRLFYYRLAEYGDLHQDENFDRLFADVSRDPFVIKARLMENPEAVREAADRSLSGLFAAMLSDFARRNGKQRWGDKTPDYVEHLDALWNMFPGCQIIHLVRDGRDVALSLSHVSWGTTHIERAASDWARMTTLGRKMGRMISDSYLEVRYESLVTDPPRELQAICDFLGEPYAPEMLEYPDSAYAYMPAESMQWHRSSVSPPTTAKIFRWKEEMSLADQIIFEEIAGPALDLFGYERVSHRPTLRSHAKRLYYHTIRRW